MLGSMRETWKTGWTKKDRAEYMRLYRLIDKAMKATDEELSKDRDLRWLRWRIDAMSVAEGIVTESFRSTLYSMSKWNVY